MAKPLASSESESAAAAQQKQLSKARILLVDDEPSMLKALQRVLRSKTYQLTLAEGGQAGLDCIDGGVFDLIISDMRMPDIDGAQVLKYAKDQHPSCRRILLTGYSDQDATARAINDGKIDCYLEKPWDNNELKETVDRLLDEKRKSDKKKEKQKLLKNKHEELLQVTHKIHTQRENVRKELKETTCQLDLAKDELQHTFETTLKIFSRLISMHHGRDTRLIENIELDCLAIAQRLQLDEHVVEEIRRAALLYQLGSIGCSSQHLTLHPSKMDEDTLRQWHEQAAMGADALAPLEVMDYTADIIRHQTENVDGSGVPDGLSGKDIPLGARILRVVSDYHHLCSQSSQSSVIKLAKQMMLDFTNQYYDAQIVDEFLNYRKNCTDSDYSDLTQVFARQLVAGQINGRDIFNREGMLLLAKGTVFTENVIQRLLRYEEKHHIEVTVYIMKTS